MDPLKSAFTSFFNQIFTSNDKKPASSDLRTIATSRSAPQVTVSSDKIRSRETDSKGVQSFIKQIVDTVSGKKRKSEIAELENRISTLKTSVTSNTSATNSLQVMMKTLNPNSLGKLSNDDLKIVKERLTQLETAIESLTQNNALQEFHSFMTTPAYGEERAPMDFFLREKNDQPALFLLTSIYSSIEDFNSRKKYS